MTGGVLTKARQSLGWDQSQATMRKTRAHVLKLIKSLASDDYAGRDSAHTDWDVYGKRDECCLWYVKIDMDSGVPVIRSAHEADHDIELWSGKCLRK